MDLKKELGSVAEAVKKVMEADLSPKQKAIAKMAEPKHKIDAGDLAKLRAGHKPVKEEQVSEASYSATAARAGKDIGKPGKMFGKIAASAAKRYGSEERGKKVAGAILKKLRMKEDVDHEITDEEADKLVGAYEETRKTFTEMVNGYKEHGVSLIMEEVDNETFTKEFEDQKASMEGKKKQPSVSAPSTQGVKQMPEEIEVVDMTDPYDIKTSKVSLEERSLTEPEAKKKEEYVKSMKKNLSGFKSRYGEKGKSVMYATATKMAKEKA